MRIRSVVTAASAVAVAALVATSGGQAAGAVQNSSAGGGLMAVVARALAPLQAQALAAGKPPKATGQGIGDPYYPEDGNLGYDIGDYTVRLSYDPATAAITATTTITARATTSLSSFNLDFGGLTVDAATVNGVAATTRREFTHELVVTPSAPIATGTTFTTAISYHGVPSGSAWHHDADGSVTIADEPHSSTVWFPSNDHPLDKATFHLEATVPAPYFVISNGLEGATTTAPGPGGTTLTTYRWGLDTPTATYLTTIGIDRYTVRRSTLADGTPVVDAYAPGALSAEPNESQLPQILAFLETVWGDYPAPAAGSIFMDAQIGFSLETFTRPVYTAGVGVGTIVHENGHMWWGDNVSIKQWKDICLNECFASYSQWLWDEHNGVDLDARYLSTVGSVQWKAKLYDMGAGHEFDGAGVYTKGKYFLHALRKKVGDATFFASLKAVQTAHSGGNMSMRELRDELQTRTGVDLTSFWAEWVEGTRKPSTANLYPGSLTP